MTTFSDAAKQPDFVRIEFVRSAVANAHFCPPPFYRVSYES